LLVVHLVVYEVASLVFTVWFWRRKDLQPIKARKPYFIVFANAVGALTFLVNSLNRILPHAPCPARVFANYATAWYYSVYAIRAFTLWFKFELAAEITSHLQHDQVSSSWFARHKAWIKSRGLLAIASVVTIVIFVPFGLLFVRGECSVQLGNWVSVFHYSLLLLFYVVFVVQFRKELDFFWLKTELVLTLIAGVLAACIWVPFGFLIETEFPVATLASLWLQILGLCFSTVYPLYLSYRHDTEDKRLLRPSTTRSSISLVDLSPILSHPAGFKAFEQFLKGEFALESLYFWNSVKEFRQKLAETTDWTDDLKKESLQKAEELYSEFVKKGAVYEINISFVRKNEILTNLESIQRMCPSEQVIAAEEFRTQMDSLFATAQKDVLELMTKDSFIRFRRSAFFQQVEKAIDSKARTTQALSELKIL